jgi:hypothetical protein
MNSIARILGFVLFSAVGIAACASNTISASDYNSSCSTNEECVEVYDGDVCDDGLCNPTAAINKSAMSQFEADRSKLREDCPEVRYMQDPCTGKRKPSRTRCAAGKCIVEQLPSPADAGADGG